MIEYLDNILQELIKWWKDKQFKKKIIYYKDKINEKKES
jgi:hypothetical protein